MPVGNAIIAIFRPNAVPSVIVSAGLDFIILCDVTVQLNGSVIIDPSDMGTHVYLWEQLSGAAVTLDDPNILTPTFTNPNTTGFTFRLYVD